MQTGHFERPLHDVPATGHREELFGMPEQTAIPFYYTVRLAPRDPAEMLHGALYDLRRAYYESGKRGRVSSHSAYNGFPCHTQGFLSRHNLKWQRRIGHQIREEAFRFEKGHALLLRNEQGALIGRIVYGAEQQWLRSAYLIPGQAEPPGCTATRPGTRHSSNADPYE